MPDPRVGINAGFGINLVSGFGFQAEVERSIRSAVKHNSCLSTEGSCSGAGELGTKSILAGTLRMVYTFGPKRVRPFVSIGFSELQRVYFLPDIQGHGGIVYSNQHRTYIGLSSLALGRGAQIRLNRSIAFRSAFTTYRGANYTSVSMGIVIRR